MTHRDMESDVDAGLDRDLACPIPFCDAARWRRPLNDAGAWNGVAMGSMAAAMAHPASDFAAIVCDFFETPVIDFTFLKAKAESFAFKEFRRNFSPQRCFWSFWRVNRNHHRKHPSLNLWHQNAAIRARSRLAAALQGRRGQGEERRNDERLEGCGFGRGQGDRESCERGSCHCWSPSCSLESQRRGSEGGVLVTTEQRGRAAARYRPSQRRKQ